MSAKFCVYLTTYSGSKLPPFYIGSAPISRITNEGYKGSVSSIKYKEIWNYELLHNPHLFKTKIISTHYSRKEAFIKEEYFHRKLNVVKSPMYINLTIANGKWGGLSGKDNPMFGVTLQCNIQRMTTNNPMFNPETRAKVSASKIGKPTWAKGKKLKYVSDRMKSNNPMKDSSSLDKMLETMKSKYGGSPVKGTVWIAHPETKLRKRIQVLDLDIYLRDNWIQLSNRKPIPDHWHAIQPLLASTPASDLT